MAADLAELQRIDRQAHVAVLGEPDAVRLIGRLVAVAALVRVPAHVEHGRQPLARWSSAGPIEVAGHVESGRLW